MGHGDAKVDAYLAFALTGRAPWPADLEPRTALARIVYHGLPGLLADRTEGWPLEAAEPIRDAALAQSMWELRHRLVLSDLLGALEAASVRTLVLKGTALAYDLYDLPAARTRGDSDLLVAPDDVGAARRVLSDQGFSPFLGDPETLGARRLQEVWEKRTPDGLGHPIDLHWQALNAQALGHALPFDVAWTRARPLPRLAPGARALPLDLALLLACAHRAQHVFTPYLVEGETHYGGDRLIWLWDIHRLACALDAAGWDMLERSAQAGGLAAVALDGLRMAARLLDTPLPPPVIGRLAALPQDTPEARYLLGSGQVGRAWRDLRAARGTGARLAFLRDRLLPSAVFLRAKYPDRADGSLPALHLRRMADFLRPRKGGAA